ncbi:MAG: LysR family transcriptional regulator [Clostridiales bacterium]|nr:LysR family transcriptional regulator [Clostridiales bacterium]
MKGKFSLDSYRVFTEVYECSSFTEAAGKLFVTQSAVSQSIRQLEAMLGVELFVRSGRAVKPTMEAKELYAMISPALDTIGDAENKLEQLKQFREGSLRIGAADTVARRFLLPYLQRWHDQYPGVRLEVTNRTSTEAFRLLAAGKIDMAFVNSPVMDDKLSRKCCLQLHDVFVAGEKYSHLKGKRLKREEVAQLPLIMLEKLSNTRRWIDEQFSLSGVRLRPEIELGAHDLMVDFARIGLGVSCVTREFSNLNGGLFELEMEQPLPARELDLCWLETGNLSAARRKFMEMF